jgi:hypothetical protein
MNDQQAQAEARLFLYDLANLAKENWFKPQESWVISLVTETEKIALEKQYRPTLFITGETEPLQKVYELLKLSLKTAEPTTPAARHRSGRKIMPTYLLAYSPGRERS